jgi:hypothetical protein
MVLGVNMLCLAAGATPCNCPSSGSPLPLFFPKKQEVKLNVKNAKVIVVKYPFI